MASARQAGDPAHGWRGGGAGAQPEPEPDQARQVASRSAEVERTPRVDGGPDVALDLDVAPQVGLTERVGRGRPEEAPDGVRPADDDPGGRG